MSKFTRANCRADADFAATQMRRNRVPTAATAASMSFANPPIGVEDLPIQIVLARLSGVGGGPTTWFAECPAHADKRPSLSITATSDHKVLLYCHRGCATPDVLAAIGLEFQHLFPSAYALAMRGAVPFATASLEISPTDQGDGERLQGNAALAACLDACNADDLQIERLAAELGVATKALRDLGVAFDRSSRSFLFPERNAEREVVGLLKRTPEGAKKTKGGSRRGLAIPSSLSNSTSPVIVAEGATDTAALLTVGRPAFGRPQARSSTAVVNEIWRLILGRRAAVILADRDRDDAGLDGAVDLARTLSGSCPRILVALPAPGFKDVREQIAAGGWRMGLKKEMEFK